MKTIKPILILLILFNVTIGWCQKKDTVITYFKVNYSGYIKPVDNIDSADYYRVVFPPDSGEKLLNVREFYKDGTQKYIGKCLPLPLNNPHFYDVLAIPDGTVINFFPNGKRQNIVTYKAGEKKGLEYNYYPNGKLYSIRNNTPPEKGAGKYLIECYDTAGVAMCKDGEGRWLDYTMDMSTLIGEGPVKNGVADGEWRGFTTAFPDTLYYSYVFANGKFVSGKSWDKSSNKYTFSDLANQHAGYEKNIFTLMSSLQSKLSPYLTAKGKNFYTECPQMCFTIKTDGSIKDIQLAHGTEPEDVDAIILQHVIKVLNKSSGWIPRKHFGKPIESKFFIYLNFEIPLTKVQYREEFIQIPQ